MKNFALKGKSLFCLGFLLISMVGTAVAQTFTSTAPIVSQDGQGTVVESCTTVSVSGITNNVTVSNVALTNLNHTYIGDTVTAVVTPAFDVFSLASPPDLTSCNYSGNYIFSDSGTNFIDAVAAGCTTNQVVAPGTYRTSDYGGGDDPGTVTSLASDLGTFTPAEANGDWLVCVFDYAGGDTGGADSASITFAGPTAASISISGRVLSPNGNPIRNIDLTLTDGNGNVQMTRSAINGGFIFENLPAGTFYTVTAWGKKYKFAQPTQFFNGTQDFTEVNFVGYSVSPF